MSPGSSSTVEVRLRVDQLAMEPLERFSLRLDPEPGFELDPSTEVFIDELTIEIIDNDSEQKWSLSLHSSMPPSLPPFFFPFSFLLCSPLPHPYILYYFLFFSWSSPSLSPTIFPPLLPFLTHTSLFLSPPRTYMKSQYLLPLPPCPSTRLFFSFLSANLPTSYHSFLLLSYSSYPSQMCHFGLPRMTMLIQRTFLKLDSKCNVQL